MRPRWIWSASAGGLLGWAMSPSASSLLREQQSRQAMARAGLADYDEFQDAGEAIVRIEQSDDPRVTAAIEGFIGGLVDLGPSSAAVARGPLARLKGGRRVFDDRLDELTTRARPGNWDELEDAIAARERTLLALERRLETDSAGMPTEARSRLREFLDATKGKLRGLKDWMTRKKATEAPSTAGIEVSEKAYTAFIASRTRPGQPIAAIPFAEREPFERRL